MIDYGYISENGMIENNTSADGWFESHYIGPTKKKLYNHYQLQLMLLII